MASNSFGALFRFTTFGESHGAAIGVVIDGCMAGLSLNAEEINQELFRRRPGQNGYTSPRTELDKAEILSGIFEGQTTGAPICILIRNEGSDSSAYEDVKELYRPGHANFTYLEKYGIFDYRGGGRASARETACRVAAGAVAKKILSHFNIECAAFISEIGGIEAQEMDLSNLSLLRERTYANPVFCPDEAASLQIMQKLQAIKEEGDSLGGIVRGIAHLPVGLGEPVYCKLEVLLAGAMLSIPASKGFEIGKGFAAARMKGSEHNDSFSLNEKGKAIPSTHLSGGTLGGISNGSPLIFRVAFKPASSIKKPQPTVNFKGEQVVFQIPESGKHDPCVAIRAVPVVEAMTACVLVDLLLMHRSSKL